MSRPLILVLVAAVLVIGACSRDSGELYVDDPSVDTPDYRFVIAAGTGEAIDRGEEVTILPAELVVRVGESIEIVNEDDRGHLVGPFYVGSGETLRQRFSTAGDFVGICSVHPSGQLTLRVIEA